MSGVKYQYIAISAINEIRPFGNLRLYQTFFFISFRNPQVKFAKELRLYHFSRPVTLPFLCKNTFSHGKKDFFFVYFSENEEMQPNVYLA